MRVFIYFIGSENGPIKIGKAKNVLYRLRGIQTGSPYQLSILGVMLGRPELEKAMHSKFKNYRLNGEWFEASEEIKEFIAMNTIPYEAAPPIKAESDQQVYELKQALNIKTKDFEDRAVERVFKNCGQLIENDLTTTWISILSTCRELIDSINAVDRFCKENGIEWGGSTVIRNQIRSLLRHTLWCDWRTAQWLLYEDTATGEILRDRVSHWAKIWIRENKLSICDSEFEKWAKRK